MTTITCILLAGFFRFGPHNAVITQVLTFLYVFFIVLSLHIISTQVLLYRGISGSPSDLIP